MLEHRCCVSQVPCWAWLSQMPEPRPGLFPSPCHQCLHQATFAPHPPDYSHCSSLNCLQLGCITVITRRLRLNAVGSAGQNSRPEAQETGWNKGRGCPNWSWNPPAAPTGQPAPVSSYAPLPGSQEQRLKIGEGLLGKIQLHDDAGDDRKNLEFQSDALLITSHIWTTRPCL